MRNCNIFDICYLHAVSFTYTAAHHKCLSTICIEIYKEMADFDSYGFKFFYAEVLFMFCVKYSGIIKIVVSRVTILNETREGANPQRVSTEIIIEIKQLYSGRMA